MKNELIAVTVIVVSFSVLLSAVPVTDYSTATPIAVPDTVTTSFNYSQSIHAYAIGNLTATQEPGYSYSGQTSPMPSQIIIVVQAIGNSTVSAYYNDTLLSTQSGLRIFNVPFQTPGTNFSVTLPTVQSTLSIVVSNAQSNTSMTFSYKLNVLSVTQFIHYEYAVHNQPLPNIAFSVGSFWASLVLLATVMTSCIFGTLYFIPLIWRNKKNKGD